MRRLAYVFGLGLIAAMVSPAVAAPGALSRSDTVADIEPAWSKAQVSIQFGYGHRPYRPYYGHRPYYGYGPRYYYDDEPVVTYRSTEPYVVRPAPPPVPHAQSGDPDAIAKCASRFRSFNANTGTYVTHDGEQRLCPYLR